MINKEETIEEKAVKKRFIFQKTNAKANDLIKCLGLHMNFSVCVCVWLEARNSYTQEPTVARKRESINLLQRGSSVKPFREDSIYLHKETAIEI